MARSAEAPVQSRVGTSKLQKLVRNNSDYFDERSFSCSGIFDAGLVRSHRREIYRASSLWKTEL